MPVPTSFADLSTTAASNSPAGGDNVLPSLDDYLRISFAMLGSIYANTSTNGWVSPYAPTASPTFTGVASFADGSAAAPSITNTGDTNTGISFPAADTLAISTGGTERMRIDAGGTFYYKADAGSTDYEVGFRDVPMSSTTGETATAAIRGKCYLTTGGITVPASTFAAGDVFSIVNNSASAITITQGASTTLRLAGTSTTGNRTLAAYGIATVLCAGADTFWVSGAGVS